MIVRNLRKILTQGEAYDMGNGNNPDYVRSTFLEALKVNRYDEDTHRVFADWLEEHGEDDLAEFHRTWTKEWQEWRDGRDYFEELAKEHLSNTCSTRSMDEAVELLLQAGRDYVANGTSTMVSDEPGDMGFGLSDGFNNWDTGENTIGEFWKHWQVLEKVKLEEGQTILCPFRCCY